MARFAALFLALLAGAHADAEIPGCKIRITSKALELCKRGAGGGGGGWGHPKVGAGAKALLLPQ